MRSFLETRLRALKDMAESEQPTVRELRAEDWRVYRELRLAALRDSPNAFGSTIEREQAFPDTQWQQLASCDPAILFASWLEGQSPRAQIIRLIELGRAPAAAAPGPGKGMHRSYYNFVALGHVADGADAAHIMYRNETDETSPWIGEAEGQLATLPVDEQALTRQIFARGHAVSHSADGSPTPHGDWWQIAASWESSP